MLREVRKKKERLKRFEVTYDETGDFTFMGEQGYWRLKWTGPRGVSLKVQYPLRNFDWLDRDRIERDIKQFLIANLDLTQYFVDIAVSD